MNPDYQITLDFLKTIYPDGPWMLTAISPDQRSILSKTFWPESEHDLLEWLQFHRKHNLYYSVNEPIPKAFDSKKLSKLDVARVHYLHVDVDPRKDEPIETEQQRILAQIQAYSTTPTVVIFSGGGYNCLWRLEQPLDVANNSPSDEETLHRAIDIERRNWQFELDFSTPDHCRDVSRILRLPGTINWPNKKKLEAGRTPVLASVVSIHEKSYPLSHFVAVPLVSDNVSASKAAKVSSNIQRIADVSFLGQKYAVPQKVQVIIAQGFDPEKPNENEGSRSEWLFFVCCELVRHGVPDEIILGVITDSRFGISASVLDKGAATNRYAIRQITRAKANAVHPRLMEMNERFAVIHRHGGLCVIMTENPDGTVDWQRPKEFFFARESSKIVIPNKKGVEVEQNDGKWWFSQALRREYERVVFEPGIDVPDAYNLFRGFTKLPKEGNLHLGLLEHVFENICSSTQDLYDYIIRWMARMVQFPRTQSETAVVLIGGRGTGKSFLCDALVKIIGRHAIKIDSMEQLTGRFNSHLGDKIFVVAEEAYHVYERRHESTLKELITGRMRAIEKKGHDIISRPNYCHLMMTSNSERVVPAGDKERRFFVLRVGEGKIQNSAYFAKIHDQLEEGGYENFLHYLMTIDVQEWNVRDVPQTTALREQQLYNLSYELEWLLGKLHKGIWLTGFGWTDLIEKEALYRDYMEHVIRLGVTHPMPYRVWHEWLLRNTPNPVSMQSTTVQKSGYRPMKFQFPPLTICRQRFLDDRAWKEYDWDEPYQSKKRDEEESPNIFS